MNNFTIVRPEHLNHHGYLFGGSMLRWVDEYAWLVATLDFPGCTLVTVGMDAIRFRQRVLPGSILRFRILPLEQGNTSISYNVEVFADEPGGTVEKEVFSTSISFVRLDEAGNKTPLPRSGPLRSALRHPSP